MFKDLRDQGKFLGVGLSEVTVSQITYAPGIVPIVSVQNRYSLADKTYEDVLDYCNREQIGFIPWNPINAGNLGSLGVEVDRAAKRHGVTAAQLALAWLLWSSPIIIPIPGTSRVPHLGENVAAAALRLDKSDLQELSRAA